MAFVDARARDLGLALDAPPQPALAALTGRHEGLLVELRVLGCSHQALLGDPTRPLSEVVSCRPADGPGMPQRLDRVTPAGRYAFASSVLTLSGRELERRARRVVETVDADPLGLAAAFPGLPNAFTAMRWWPEGGCLRWETWHSYPQTGEIVHTESVLELP